MAELVLIDDDDLIRMTWEMVSSNRGDTLCFFDSCTAFIEGQKKPSKENPIFIDWSMSEENLLRSFIRELYEQGYQKLYITTGFDPSTIEKPAEIQKIVSKEYPEEILNTLG